MMANISEHAATCLRMFSMVDREKPGLQQGGNKQGFGSREVRLIRVEPKQMADASSNRMLVSLISLIVQSSEPLESTCTAKHAEQHFTEQLASDV